jgi:hypothetical protein
MDIRLVAASQSRDSHSFICKSRVATLHLIVHELLVFLVVPVAIEVPASYAVGGAPALKALQTPSMPTFRSYFHNNPPSYDELCLPQLLKLGLSLP